MKIAICNVQEFNPTIGGIERVSVSLAEGLIKEGVEVLFVALSEISLQQTLYTTSQTSAPT